MSTITAVRDDLDRVCFVAGRIAEFSEHNVEFTPLRHLVEKLLATTTTLRHDLNRAEMGHLMDGTAAVVERRRPVGIAATGDRAIRRAAYQAALKNTPAGGDFERLRHEQELIDPDCALWRQYAPAQTCGSPA